MCFKTVVTVVLWAACWMAGYTTRNGSEILHSRGALLSYTNYENGISLINVRSLLSRRYTEIYVKESTRISTHR